MEQPVKRVVIVGGGFAGLNLIKKTFERQPFPHYPGDKNNYTFFPPLLYQVATAFDEPSNIGYPFRRVFQKKPQPAFSYGFFKESKPAQNNIETDTGIVEYDYLVLAHGYRKQLLWYGAGESKCPALENHRRCP